MWRLWLFHCLVMNPVPHERSSKLHSFVFQGNSNLLEIIKWRQSQQKQLIYSSITRTICLITTGDCCFAVCQSTRQSPVCTRQRLCRMPHTAFRCRQRRPLPCAIYRAHGKAFAVCQSWPTKKKQKIWEVTLRPPLSCACRCGTQQSSNVCRVP